jgi:hypothetical protein
VDGYVCQSEKARGKHYGQSVVSKSLGSATKLPWPIKYLLPAVKWFPLYWPNDTWEIVPFPAIDEFGNRIALQPPDGAIIPWWKMDKSQWPIAAPWEPKIFGAWPASQISMPEDLQNVPPFGFIKLKVPGHRDTSSNQIAFMNMKIHVRPQIDHFTVLTIWRN